MRGMSNQKTPALLADMADEVTAGALLKHRDGSRAIVVDTAAGKHEATIAVRPKKKFRDLDTGAKDLADVQESELYPAKPADYELFEIKDSKEWIVLDVGTDDVLME